MNTVNTFKEEDIFYIGLIPEIAELIPKMDKKIVQAYIKVRKLYDYMSSNKKTFKDSEYIRVISIIYGNEDNNSYNEVSAESFQLNCPIFIQGYQQGGYLFKYKDMIFSENHEVTDRGDYYVETSDYVLWSETTGIAMIKKNENYEVNPTQIIVDMNNYLEKSDKSIFLYSMILNLCSNVASEEDTEKFIDEYKKNKELIYLLVLTTSFESKIKLLNSFSTYQKEDLQKNIFNSIKQICRQIRNWTKDKEENSRNYYDESMISLMNYAIDFEKDDNELNMLLRKSILSDSLTNSLPINSINKETKKI